jgi:glutamyl-tRNA synthetase
MSDKKVRVRFAPSPTGPLHMGGVRTALYNYLFAKKNNGTFIVRVEDTDQTRFVEGAEEYVMDALKWCGIEPDESPVHGGEFGPYRQSDRKAMYKPYAEQLVELGHAYYAFDSSEELDNMREQAKIMKMPNWQYNSITRSSMKNSLTLPTDEVEQRIASGDSYVIRFKMPRNEDVRFEDIVRGWVVVNTNNIDDKVLFKSDGMPTYHMANIVDDHTMKITHVIRGEEWLPSAPLHVLLYQAFNWEAPKFAHLPLLLRPDGNGKLSKRDGDRLGFPVFPTNWTTKDGELYSGYREQGYFKGAFINMLALLGWNPGTEQEIFSLEGLVNAFSLERVSKAGAKYDADKTRWFQQQYLRAESNEKLADLVANLSDEVYKKPYLAKVCELMKERATFVKDIVEEGKYFFNSPTEFDSNTVNKKWKEDTTGIMQEWMSRLEKLDTFNNETIEVAFKAYLEEIEKGIGAVLPAFRVLITGKGMGPSMFEIAALLGKEEVLSRMSVGIEKVTALKEA